MAWTSRQRVVAAIEHREPDRVPIDFNPVPDFYLKLKEHLGLEIEEQLKLGFMEEAIPHPKVLDALGADMISVKLGSAKTKTPPPASTGPDMVTDSWGVGLKRVFQGGGGSYLEPVYHPLAEADIDDLEKYPWPDPYAPGRGEGAHATAKRLYEDTDLALVGRFGGPIVQTAIYMMGFQRWLECSAYEVDFAGVLLDKITDQMIAVHRCFVEKTRDHAPPGFHHQHGLLVKGRLLIREDSGILISPAMYADLVVPFNARLSEALGSVGIHFCGNGQHQIENMLSIPSMECLDMGQPEMNDVEATYAMAAAKRVPLVRDTVPADELTGRALSQRFPTGVSFIHHPTTVEEAKRVCEGYYA